MAINALSPSSIQGFRPQGGAPSAINSPGQTQAGGRQAPGDAMGLSREAQQAGGARGGAQQLTQSLTQGIAQVMQAQMGGDENASKQAIQGLGQTYQQGKKSGQLDQVPPVVKQTAEALLGQGQQDGGQEAQGAGKGGGGG